MLIRNATLEAPSANAPVGSVYSRSRVGGTALSAPRLSVGAEVTGLSRGVPTTPSLYELARVGSAMAAEHAADVRDAAGPVSFVGDLLVGHAFELARALLDRTVDIVNDG